MEKDEQSSANVKQDFILSDESKINDKDFKVDLSGGDFARFDANPVMLYMHKNDKVIGIWEDRRIADGKLIATTNFDMEDEEAAEIAGKVERGYLRGASLGIRPVDMEKIEEQWVMTKWELVEVSITPIPSDAGAVRLYNEQREEMSFDTFKLSYNNNQNNSSMSKERIELSAKTQESLELKSDYTAKDIELAVQEKDDKITEQSKEIETLQAEKVTTLLSQAVKDGKIQASEMESYSTLAATNFESVKAIIDGKSSQNQEPLKGLEQRTGLSGDRASWDYLKWTKEDPRGLQRLKAENSVEFERLESEYKQTLQNS